MDNFTHTAVDGLAIRQSRCGTGPKGPTWELPPAPLAPLAKLPYLAEFKLLDDMAQLAGGLPQQWGASGAFPRLTRCAALGTCDGVVCISTVEL